MLFLPAQTRPALAALLLPLLFALAPSVADAAERELITVPVRGGDRITSAATLPSQQAVSADGSRVVFSSAASNLDDVDGGKFADVWVRDRQADENLRVSATAAGTEPNAESIAPALSADGRYVAFVTRATNLGIDSGSGLFYDVVRRDLTKAPAEAGAYTLIALDVTQAASEVQPSISADGNRVAFSTRDDLSSSDTDFVDDVYVRDVTGNVTRFASPDEDGRAMWPSISADGTRVAYRTLRNVTKADPDGEADVYVRNLAANSTTHVTPTLTAEDTIGTQLSLDEHGVVVGFSTNAALVPDDTNGGSDVYLRPLDGGATVRASVGAGNRQAEGGSDRPVVSTDASFVAFATGADDLVPEGSAAVLRHRATARTTSPNESDGAPSVAGDGSLLVYPRAIAGADEFTELYAEATALGDDVTPPSLIVPGDLDVSATSPSGRIVRFREKGTDSGSGLRGTVCSPGSGERFPVGQTTVRCVAADLDGNETAKTFVVRVTDRQPPRLSVPTRVTLVAPKGGKVPADHDIRGTDNVDGAALTPTCTPPAGTELAAGTTTVNCQVTDAAGNSAEGSFGLVVTEQDDAPSASAAVVETNEKARGVAVQLTLATAPKTDLVVPFTLVDGSALAGEDFSTTERTVTVKAGSRTATAFVKLTDDLRPEGEEGFQIRFEAAGFPAATGAVTIADDDGPLPDKRRKDVGPMVWVDDSGENLLKLEGDETEPRVIVHRRGGYMADPQVSPDGTEVLFTSNRQVFRAPIDGGKPEWISGTGEMGADHPIWRPDGEAIVFLGHEGPATWLRYVSLTDPSERIDYGVANATADAISWSPDGSQLMFIESYPTDGKTWDTADLAILDAETGKIVRRWVTDDFETQPEWSPDGKSVVFLRQHRAAKLNTWTGESVAKMDLATGVVTELTGPADVASGSGYGAPTWSADGQAIAFVDQDRRRGTTRYPFRIATMSASGGPLSTRYDFAAPERQADVPDQGYLEWAGRAAGGPTDEGRIVFARQNSDGTSSRLLSVRPNGEDERVVAQLGTLSSEPSVAADGTWLAWASNRDQTAGEIYVSTPGGRAIERITTNTVADDQPSISEDGRRVAFVRGAGKAREIWVYDREEREETRVVAPTEEGVGEPAFVNGAEAIAYVKYGDVPEIRRINLSGSGDRRLTDGTAPAFDRRGTSLAFQRAVGTTAPQVYVAEADGTSAEKMTEEPGGATHPAWGPDDRSLTYASRLGISATTTDGGQAFLVTTEPHDAQPTWARVAALPKLRIEDAATTEGTGGITPVGLSLSIDRPVDDPVTVSFATADGSAKTPRDYVSKGPVTVTIPAGDVAQTESTEVQADAMDEPEESFLVQLTNPTGAQLSRAEASVSIRDDDDPPTLSVADVRMPEGDLGDSDAVFTLRLSAESGWTVGAHAATAHVTTNDDDLRARSVDVTWEPGVIEQIVRVPVIGDTQNEPDETFSLVLSGQSHVTGPAGPATGTLVNDDVVGKLPDTGITGAPGTLITTPTPTFEFIGSVPRGLFQCRVDQLPWQPCTTPHRIRAVADGQHTFAVRALDGDLLDPSPATHTFTVDTVAPSTTITTGPARVSAVKSPTIALATDDATAGFQCKTDDAPWTPCAARFQLPVLPDGNHAFAARAIDPAGNVDPTPAAIAFRVDSKAPQTTWTDPTLPQGSTAPTSSAASVGLTAGAQPKLTLDATGVARVPVSCSPASTAPCTGQVVVEELPAGRKAATDAMAKPLAAHGPVVLARADYSVAPGVTEPVAISLSRAARAKVERKGRINARAVVTSSGGMAAPVPIVLIADPATPRLLDAGTSQRAKGRDGRDLTFRIACVKPRALPKTATKAQRKAAAAAAKAACRGTVEVRVDGTTSVSRARLNGTPGRTARVRVQLTKPAAARVRSTKSTPSTLRLVWGQPTRVKTTDLTLTRGASR